MSAGDGVPEVDPSSTRRGSQDPGPDLQRVRGPPPLSIDKVLSKSEKLRERPDDLQQWIESLEPTVPNAQVPIQIAALRGTATYLGKPGTFGEVLADLMTLWYDKRFNRNVSHGSPKSKENKQFSWLLTFANDYIKLSEEPMSPSCVNAITRAATQVCLKAGVQDHIEAAIPILSFISQNYEYPTPHIPETMAILSGAIVKCPGVAESIHACFRPLVNNGFGIAEMFNFLSKPTKESKSGLRNARGALRLLCRLIGVSDRDGNAFVDVSDLVVALNKAARQGFFLSAVDILSACHTALVSDEQGNLTQQEIGTIADTVRMCLAMKPLTHEQEVAETSSTKYTREEYEEMIQQHLEGRLAGATSIGVELASLSQQRPNCWTTHMNDYVLEHPTYSPGEHAFQCLSRAAVQKLFSPPAPRWMERCDWLLQKFLADRSLAADVRKQSITMLHGLLIELANAPTSVLSISNNRFSPLRYICKSITDATLRQIPMEEDGPVLEALYIDLPQLTVSLPDSEQDHELVNEIIRNLSGLVMHRLPLTAAGRGSALHATKTLVQIMARNFDSHPKRAIEAYESLTTMVKIECRFPESRIEAMRALFRLRSTREGHVYLSNVNDSDYIATALCRTRASADSFDFDASTDQRQSASSTTLHTKSSAYPKLWMYDDEQVIFESCTPSGSITVSEIDTEQGFSKLKLDIGAWLLQVIYCLQSDPEWETSSLCLVYGGSQLSNVSLFKGCLSTIVELRKILCDQLVRGAITKPPLATGLKQSDVALCLYNILTPLIAYASMQGGVIQKVFGDDLVRAFLYGIGGQYEGTDRGCIHALSLCALEIPRSVASQYPSILDRLSNNISRPSLTLHILEFLSQVATLTEVHSNFREEDIQTIFMICITFLQKTREQTMPTRTATPARHSGVAFKRPPYRAAMLKDPEEPRYASALVYHTMICWFLSLPLQRRKFYVTWLMRNLPFKNSSGMEVVDEQSEVFIDMMQRTAFSDLGETAPIPDFAKVSDGPVDSASWVVGYSIITAETAGRTGLTQITKRQASGTTYSIYQQSTTPLPPHHTPGLTAIRCDGDGGSQTVEMLPPHVLLQMVTTAAPTRISDQPVALPKNDLVDRALRVFDHISTVDSYKAGVLYIGPNQTKESEFLMVQAGSADYDRFLQGLGYEVALQPPLRFNPQDLSPGRDGKSTIAWRDRVTEIVFLVPTMMPPNEDDDPEWLTKKSFVGNCHVNIIFNRSGDDWSFDNLPSAFNSINIVISPADLTEETEQPEFYCVQVLTKDHFPNISPAADPKVISAEQLPKFVRLLAINANVFSEVWKTKKNDKEFPSNWRTRLQAIKRLKEQITGRQDIPSSGGSSTHTNTLGPSGGRRTPVPRDDSAGGGHSGGALAMQLDFGRWTA